MAVCQLKLKHFADNVVLVKHCHAYHMKCSVSHSFFKKMKVRVFLKIEKLMSDIYQNKYINRATNM